MFGDNGAFVLPKRDPNNIELPKINYSITFNTSYKASSPNGAYSSIQVDEMRNYQEENRQISIMQTAHSYNFNDSKKSFDNVVFDVLKVDPDIIGVRFYLFYFWPKLFLTKVLSKA